MPNRVIRVAGPRGVFGVVLSVVFVAEAAIMISLPRFLPRNVDWITESLLDAFLLTLAVAPVFWMLLVRPLGKLLEFRTKILVHTMSAQEQERRRIARDLHDEVGQTVTSLLIGLRTVADAESLDVARTRAEELRSIATAVLSDIKRIARGLRPSVLDDIGLAPALERLVLDFGRTHDIGTSLDLDRFDGERLPEPLEVAIYRIVQEALTNIAKHAQAKNVRVSLHKHGDQLRVAVQDDGCGFAAASAKELIAGGHWGLTGMQERAAMLGGHLSVESAPGQGTTIVARLPLVVEVTDVRK